MNAVDSFQPDPPAGVAAQVDPYREIREAFRRALAETLERVAVGQNIDHLLAQLLRERAPAAVPVAVAPQPPVTQRAPSPARMPLTAREQEILARIAAGDSNKEIARTFDLSLHTVKRHVANILTKLGVSSRVQAATWMHARH